MQPESVGRLQAARVRGAAGLAAYANCDHTGFSLSYPECIEDLQWVGRQTQGTLVVRKNPCVYITA